jgi:hypothetical protein
MELLPTPNFGTRIQLPELNLLTHESRHTVQMEKQNQGIFRPFYFILGEQTAGIASFFKSQWLLEGEAVVAETALSSSGRGRMTSFTAPYAAQIASGKNFSLDKWFLGSYRDYTHDFYALGYAMVSYLRLNYGADVWNRIWNEMNCSLLQPLAMKKHTGLTSAKLFNLTFEALKKEREALTPEKPDSLTFISRKHRRYVSYRYPQETANGIISLKTSLSELHSIVLTDSLGREHFLTYTGNINSKLTHYGGFVYWTEYVPGLRWKHENYSEVKQMDLQTLRVKTVSKRSRYFVPAVLPGKIAVFEHEPDGQNNIVIISRTGEKLKSFPVIDNMPVLDMAADSNGKILTVLTGKNGNAIFRFDPNTSLWEKLSDCLRTDIGSLRICGESALFESGYSGVQNIYSLDTSSLTVRQLTNSMYGSFSGTLSRDGRKLYLSDYSVTGHRIASIDINHVRGETVSFDRPYRFEMAESLSAQESFNIDEHNFDDTVEYKSEPYRKAAHLFNVHSWFPFYLNLDEATENYRFEFNQIKPGILLLSQNSLNTLTSQLSYYYDNNQSTHHGFLSVKYSGWFPVLNLKVNAGGRRHRVSYDNSHLYVLKNQNRVNVTFSAYLPFNFTNDHNIHGLQPFVNLKYDNGFTGSSGRSYGHLYSGIYYYRYNSLAHNDIFPRLGWQAWISYAGNPYNSDMNELLVGKLNLFLPGILRDHGLRISASLQRQIRSGSMRHFFSERYIDIARGRKYDDYTGEKKIYTLKGDYSFPIVYPDIKAGSLIYLSRIRGNLFYDITVKQPSCGFDLMFDMYFFRIRYAPATLMFRTVKMPGQPLINSFSIGVSF